MRDHFDLLAPIYDKVIQPKPPDRLAQILDLDSSTQLLDVGGGTGRITQYFTNNSRQVILLDSSLQMLQKSQSKVGLDQINGASEVLPFPNHQFDRILMVDALHHVYDQQRTAQELWRVLKPGGKIVIEEPNIARFAVKLIAIAEKLAFMRSHFLSGEEIGDLFRTSSSQVQYHQEDHFIWVEVLKPEKKS
jgi:demethylmenaquinone methyltransferase/2-methoxy-6-polyprenyl-1,4-benzoquinol methylase